MIFGCITLLFLSDSAMVLGQKLCLRANSCISFRRDSLILGESFKALDTVATEVPKCSAMSFIVSCVNSFIF